jgi:hypothetical protein
MATLIRLKSPRATLGAIRSARRLLLLLDGGRVEGAVEEKGDAEESLMAVFGTMQGKRLAECIAPFELPVDPVVFDAVLREYGRHPVQKSAIKPSGRAARKK